MFLIKTHLKFVSLIVVIFSLLLCIAIPVKAQAGDSDEQNPELMVAKIYAERYRVTVDEALFRLELQEAFPELRPAIENNEKETFGGLWIQHEPEYKIFVAFTNNGETTIKKYEKYIPAKITPYIVIKKVKRSYEELKNDQEKLIISLKKHNIQACPGLDIINNYVEIDVVEADKEKLDAAIQSDTLKIPQDSKISYVKSLPVPCTDIYGGLALDLYQGGGPFATIGFGVKNSVGTKGIATAGHVGSVAYYNGVWLPLQGAALFFNSWDCEWRTCPGFTVLNKVKYSTVGYTWTISATKSRSAQNIGDVVSKFGITTGLTMGTISDLSYPLPTPLNVPTWIEVSNTYGYPKMADAGDSGSPVFTFTGGTAYGILSSKSADSQKYYYMAVNYLSNLGVTVMTSP